MKTATLDMPLRIRWKDFTELTKSGITFMIVVSAAVGFLLAATDPQPLALWFHTLLGTALVSAGASALNQVVERDLDAQMRRTAQRPIPGGRLHPDLALLISVVLAIVGIVELTLAVNPLAALLAGGTLAGYVFVYTPLKRVSSLATIVGAVPGAIPPMIGWAAVRGEIDAGAWALFALLFFWQMPHFLAIAWMYRDDYARGGFPMLTVRDPGGLKTARQAVLYCAALIPVSLLPAPLGLAGIPYLIGALLFGGVFFAATLSFAFDRSAGKAKRLLLVSVMYLPLILAALVLDRWIPG
ncbi:MAG: heme o synthase [Thermoanaerobaculia bacterium]|nr:heme o synthase [Thermoanaerobaculia bacterium]